MSKLYTGSFDASTHTWLVHVHPWDGRAYELSLHTPTGMVYPHSPTGHAWGYGGSGPTQLALDVLWDYLGQEPDRRFYMAFRDRFVATAPKDESWKVTSEEIEDFRDGWWLTEGPYLRKRFI